MTRPRPANWTEIVARAMAMDEAAWERHANPWSGWSRVAIAPVVVAAIWARVWIGWWCLLPIALAVAWVWANPRAFAPPAHSRAWMSRAVLGERVFLARGRVAIPTHHLWWANALSLIAALGLGPLVWGLWALEIWPTLLGLGLAMGAKFWFLDRMVWLYADMAARHPPYAAWGRPRPASERAPS